MKQDTDIKKLLGRKIKELRLKQGLLNAIDKDTIDINLMYRFYEAIK